MIGFYYMIPFIPIYIYNQFIDTWICYVPGLIYYFMTFFNINIIIFTLLFFFDQFYIFLLYKFYLSYWLIFFIHGFYLFKSIFYTEIYEPIFLYIYDYYYKFDIYDYLDMYGYCYCWYIKVKTSFIFMCYVTYYKIYFTLVDHGFLDASTYRNRLRLHIEFEWKIYINYMFILQNLKN